MKKTAKHLICFSTYLFWRFFVIHVLHMKFFFLLFFSPLASWCWNVVRWEGWERQKHTTEQADVSLHYCIQEWQRGGGGTREGGLNQKAKICTTTSVDRKQQRPSDGPTTPPNATYFSCFLCFFSFISLNIQIIRTILSCQIKKIYRGSLGFFFHYQKKVW